MFQAGVVEGMTLCDRGGGISNTEKVWRNILNGPVDKYQGRSDGGYIGIYTPPKSAQVNFLMG